METAVAEIEAGKEEAMNPDARPDLQSLGGTADVHLVWGDEKKGIFHIGQSRGRRVVAGVLEAVIRGKIGRFSAVKKTVALDHGGFTAILSLDKNGASKSWLLIGWEEGKPDAADEVGAQSGATQSRPTFGRADLGAGLRGFLALDSNQVNNPSLYSSSTQPGFSFNQTTDAGDESQRAFNFDALTPDPNAKFVENTAKARPWLIWAASRLSVRRERS